MKIFPLEPLIWIYLTLHEEFELEIILISPSPTLNLSKTTKKTQNDYFSESRWPWLIL